MRASGNNRVYSLRYSQDSAVVPEDSRKIYIFQVYIGDFIDCHFTETSVRECMDWFADEMKNISRAIQTRNLDLEIPYVYLLPEAVPKAAGQ